MEEQFLPVPTSLSPQICSIGLLLILFEKKLTHKSFNVTHCHIKQAMTQKT